MIKNIPDHERTKEKKTEMQKFINDYNNIVLNESSTSKSKLSTGKYLLSSDLEFCTTHTKFEEADILRWFKGFRKECPNGHLAKSHLSKLFRKVFPEGNGDIFTNHIFRIFDKDNNGFLDFKEFLMAIDVTSCKTKEDKMIWAFRLYDIDGNGTIDVEEMTSIIEILDDLDGRKEGNAFLNIDGESEILTSPAERAKSLLEEIDIDNSGGISLDEFLLVGRKLFNYGDDFEDE